MRASVCRQAAAYHQDVQLNVARINASSVAQPDMYPSTQAVQDTAQGVVSNLSEHPLVVKHVPEGTATEPELPQSRHGS